MTQKSKRHKNPAWAKFSYGRGSVVHLTEQGQRNKQEYELLNSHEKAQRGKEPGRDSLSKVY